VITIIKRNPKLRNAYYHLDCFMQLLPDGRVIILNSNILSEASQEKMYEIFGDDFIDLDYSGYDPVLFNFISIQKNNQTYVLASNLPADIVKSLQDLGLIVITSCMLDPTSPTYHKELAEQVALRLQKDGFETATAENLTTGVLKNRNGYPVDDGTALPPDERDKAYFVSSTGESSSLDECFSEDYRQNGFDYGVGGPHCLTTDFGSDNNMLKRQQSDKTNEAEMAKNLEYKNELSHQFNLDDAAVVKNTSQTNTPNLRLFVPADKKNIKVPTQNKKSTTCSVM
jgi:hypothetical protein